MLAKLIDYTATVFYTRKGPMKGDFLLYTRNTLLTLSFPHFYKTAWYNLTITISVLYKLITKG